MTAARNQAPDLSRLQRDLAQERARTLVLGREVLRLQKRLGEAAALMQRLLEAGRADRKELADLPEFLETVENVLQVVEVLDDKRKAQQRGNEERRAIDDGYLEEAAERHRAGEKWDAIAPDYSLSAARLRTRVRKAGLPTRGSMKR
jgi:hypothetical protein